MLSINPRLQTKAQAIKLLICDVDGVFSDGRIYLGNQGEELKAFHTRDGQGIKFLQAAGIEVAIITGRNSEIVRRRMGELGIQYIYQGQKDKRQAYQQLKEQLTLQDHEIAYIGDDLPDLPLIIRAGLGCCVADAPSYIRQAADYCTQLPGGHGAVRELIDLLLSAQNKLADVINAACG